MAAACQAATDGADTDDAACGDPVIMVVAGVTLDAARMGAYAGAIARSGLYPQVGGYYLNAPRPVAVFEGDVDPDYVTLMVRFPCLANARAFWNSSVYQESIKPLRLDPPAGNYSVTVYRESALPDYLSSKVGSASYLVPFDATAIEQHAPDK
jgi:uncharacterized protein (DUF1330 family)